MNNPYGWTLLKNEADMKRMAKKRSVYRPAPPDEYPCWAQEWIDGSETAYLHYLYLGNIDNMAAALRKAKEHAR